MKKPIRICIALSLFLVLLFGCAHQVHTVYLHKDPKTDANQIVVPNNHSISIEDPSIDGKTFLGWFTDPQGTNPWNPHSKIKKDTHLFAKWESNSYTVSFDSEGGSYVPSQTVGFLETIDLEEPIKEGYLFEGWFYSLDHGDAFTEGTKVISDLLLIANWVRLEYTPIQDETEMEVSGYSGLLIKLEIPAMVQGLPVTRIGEGAFADALYLESIQMPDSIRTIGKRAFENNTHLREVVFSNQLEEIDDYAFSNCWFHLETLTFPESLKRIGHHAFSKASSLKQLELPASLVEIGEYGFYETVSLESVLFGNQVSKIGKYAFARSISLNEVILPNGLNKMEEGVFSECFSLEKVLLPSNIEQIDYRAFYACSSLEEVFLPSSIQTIALQAFLECNSIKEWSVAEESDTFISVDGVLFEKATHRLLFYPAGNESETLVVSSQTIDIAPHALYKAIHLKSIRFTGDVVLIGEFAFAHAIRLEKIFFEGDIVPVINVNSLKHLPSNIEIHVPNALLHQYRIASFWRIYQYQFIGVS